MKTKIIIILCISFILLVSVLFVAILGSFKKTTIVPEVVPSPTSVPVVIQSPYKVTSSTISNTSQNIPIDQPITFSFNRAVSTSKIHFFSFPQIDATITTSDNLFIITPITPLEKNIIYTYTITDTQTGEVLQKGTINTGGSSATLPLTGRYPNLDTVSDNSQLQTHPDIFLSNQTPYKQSLFSITSSFTPNPTGHYFFSITLLGDQTSAKNSFLSWLKSLGFTDTQIASLDIRYK